MQLAIGSKFKLPQQKKSQSAVAMEVRNIVEIKRLYNQLLKSLCKIAIHSQLTIAVINDAYRWKEKQRSVLTNVVPGHWWFRLWPTYSH